MTKPTTADNSKIMQEPFTGTQGSADTASEPSHVGNPVRGETPNTLQGGSQAQQGRLQKGRLPKALRDLQTYNKPGAKEGQNIMQGRLRPRKVTFGCSSNLKK